MEVIVRPTAKSAEELTANIIAAELVKKPNMTLGLATGRTMERLYDILGKKCKKGLDFSLCKTFNLDEYVGLAPDDPNSYRYYMDKNLFNKINIDTRNTHVENGLASDFGYPAGISCALPLAGMEWFTARSVGLDILSLEHSGGVLGTARQKIWKM